MDNSALQGAKEEIIVCANEKVIRWFHRKCLVHAGYRVSVCETFPALEEALEKSRPDLIILDYAFGGFPGLEAAVQIYAHEAYAGIPIMLLIFASQSFDLTVPKELLEKYVTVQHKNYTCEQLQSYITDFLAQKREGEQLKERATELINSAPGSSEGYLSLGRSFEMLLNSPEAIAAYNMAVEIDPDCADAYSLLGAIHWSGGDFEAAIQAYTQLVRLQPTNADNLRNLGYALNSCGEREKAREVWTQALEYADPSTHRSLLVVLENMKARKSGR